MVMAMVEVRHQTVVWYQGAHKQGGYVSRRDWGDSSNWNCMYYRMVH